MKKQVKRIVTHQGIFHSDEITAIALLGVFKPDDYSIERLSHNDPIENPQDYDYIIDIGRQYDGVRFFDHHQNNPKDDDRASAGLIWDYLDVDCIDYLDIKAFVAQVDANDLGLREPEVHSIISLIKSLNTADIYSKEQDEAFMFALDIVTKYIQSLKDQADIRTETYARLNECRTHHNILISEDGFIPEWQYHLVHSKYYDFFMWFDEKQDTWKIQSVPIKYGSFEFKKSLESSKKNNEVTFVHNGKFFAVGSKEGLFKLVKDSQ